MTRQDALNVYSAGKETVVQTLLTMSILIKTLEEKEKKLSDDIEHLDKQLAKNSSNSSKPPSTDGYKKPSPHSLRPASTRSSGGQKGHAGVTLTMRENPDKIIYHPVTYCEHCGISHDINKTVSIEKRQVHDLPHTEPLYVTEHQCETITCSVCGHSTSASFPENVNAPIQYGERVKAAVIYLNTYQLLPYERTCQVLADLFGCSISQGTLSNILDACNTLVLPIVENIKQHIINSSVAHFDESGTRVQKKLWWLHSASTKDATYYQIHTKRGSEAMESIGILKFFQGRAIHDFWKPYFLYGCLHGLCNVHHLRELIFVLEEYKQSWAGEMIDFLLEVKTAVATAQEKNLGCLSKHLLVSFQMRYQDIIAKAYRQNPLEKEIVNAPKKRGRKKKSQPRNLLERMDTHSEQVLAFMYDFRVPFGNNLAERDIRMIKVKQKVSGLFRSEKGAVSFCNIRSYISTALKNNVPILEAITRIFTKNPFGLSPDSI